MNLTALPFDADAMLAGLRPWVECESPTWDAAAVNRMMDLASHALVLAGARIERIPGRLGFGDCLRATVPHPAPTLPGILVLGHLDTVHPVGTLARLPFRRDQDRAWGPGIHDMKGGIFLALEAIRALARAGHATPLPVTLLLTGDEEAGSHASRGLIEAEAAHHRYVLLPEPALPMAAWSPAAAPSPASLSKPPDGRAMPVRVLPRAARRSAKWRARSWRSR